jgi:hypothetical protein
MSPLLFLRNLAIIGAVFVLVGYVLRGEAIVLDIVLWVVAVVLYFVYRRSLPGA